MRPWGWACAASALRPALRPRPGVPAPKSPPCSPPPGSPRPRPARTRRRAAARARGEGRAARWPLRASQRCSPLRRFQNTQPGSRASRGGGPGTVGAINQPAPAGRAAPGRGGKGWAPRPARPLLGPAQTTLKEKAEKGTAGEAAGGRGRIRERKRGEEREGS